VGLKFWGFPQVAEVNMEAIVKDVVVEDVPVPVVVEIDRAAGPKIYQLTIKYSWRGVRCEMMIEMTEEFVSQHGVEGAVDLVIGKCGMTKDKLDLEAQRMVRRVIEFTVIDVMNAQGAVKNFEVMSEDDIDKLKSYVCLTLERITLVHEWIKDW
jgi:hypothetical protein